MSAAAADPAVGGASAFIWSGVSVPWKPGSRQACRPGPWDARSVPSQAQRVGNKDGVSRPLVLTGRCPRGSGAVAVQAAASTPPVTAPSLCLEPSGCSSVSGEDRCGGLREQLSEVTLEAPNIVC